MNYLPSQGFNTLVIDVGDGIRYESHPEISIPGAWLKDYSRMLSTKPYYQFCKDIIAEVVGLSAYREEVLRFAAKVEAYYNACAPKELPTNEYDRNGYIAFWNEWHRRYTEAKEGAEKT